MWALWGRAFIRLDIFARFPCADSELIAIDAL